MITVTLIRYEIFIKACIVIIVKNILIVKLYTIIHYAVVFSLLIKLIQTIK